MSKWEEFLAVSESELRESCRETNSLTELMVKYNLYATLAQRTRDYIQTNNFQCPKWQHNRNHSPKARKARQQSIRKAVAAAAANRFERHRKIFEENILPTLFIDRADGTRGPAARWVRTYNKFYHWLPEICDLCNQGKLWNNLPLSLQLDHKNGRSDDERLENLRYLCPNCHTQTTTYRNRNRKGSRVRQTGDPGRT